MNTKFDCKSAFIREIEFKGNGGTINCNYYWLHVSLTLDNPIEFFNDKAEISGVVAINFNDSLFPRGGERWDNLDEKMARKVQKLFDSIGQMGDPASDDGRDKCLSNLTINKLKKMGFELSSDHFYIDKGFKDAYTGSVVAEVKELR